MKKEVSPICNDHLFEMRMWKEDQGEPLDLIECDPSDLTTCSLGCRWMSYYKVLTVDLVEAKLLGAFHG